jgi:hypothetical protein
MPRGGYREGAGRPKLTAKERAARPTTSKQVRVSLTTAEAIEAYAAKHGLSLVSSAEALVTAGARALST